MKISNKTMRRLFTASVSGALMISLASCSAAKDNTGLLKVDDIYAQAGNYKVTYGDLWNELKWESADVLTTQIENVIINKYINRITIVLSKNASELSEDDKKALGFDENNAYSEAAFNKLKETYKERLVNYVVEDIYNFSFSTDDHWDQFEDLKHSDIDLAEAKYVDEIYKTYQIETVDGVALSTLIKNADYENYEKLSDNYLKIAKGLSQIYYPQYAKELFAYKALEDDIQEAIDEDEDAEDDQWGYFNSSDYVTKFKKEYTNGYDFSALTLNFASSTEMDDTLRAFGLKMYNKKLYFIYDSKDKEEYPYLATEDKLTYEDYVDYYNDFSNSSLSNPTDSEGNTTCVSVSPQAVLEIYIQIYNYVYGGYKAKLSSKYFPSTNYNDLNELRSITSSIIKLYAENDANELLDETIATLKANNEKQTYFTAEDLEKNYGSSFKSYCYDTLKSKTDKIDGCYSTTGQSTSLGTTLVYKFEDYKNVQNKETITDSTLLYFSDWYNTNRSSYEIIDEILDTTNHPTLKADIEAYLKTDKISSSQISTYLEEELEEVEIKIYNEACEIAYSAKNEDYSNAIKKNKNSNVLATIKYEDVTWNVNIVADQNDASSVKVAGTTTAFGVFDYLEKQEGQTQAITLLSNQMVKENPKYAETNKDRQTYEDYIENILLNFTYNGFSSSGYPSTIGKYNFLMLYFHTADINDIIDNVYRVQAAQSLILTDFSSDTIINFIKKYAEISDENYFSLGGTRLLVYLDLDDDGKEDETKDWKDMLVKDYITDTTNEFYNLTFGEVAKRLVVEMYGKISSSTDSHTTVAADLATEFNGSAKVVYGKNPISAENTWAKYRQLGFQVKTTDFSATNSTLTIDFNLKQRLYDYHRGYSMENGVKTATYQYYVNDSCPTCYIEPINETTAIQKDDKTIVETNDGYNLIMVTTGTPKAKAKYERKDVTDKITENIVIKYNDEFIKIANVYNDEQYYDEKGIANDETYRLTYEQIKLYVLDYAVNGSSTLAPTEISSACSTFLQPVVERFTGTETQKIILLNYIANTTNQSATNLYSVITFTNEAYNGKDGVFDKLIILNQRVADNYLEIYEDTTGTADLYTYTENGQKITWWTSIENLLKGAQ